MLNEQINEIFENSTIEQVKNKYRSEAAIRKLGDRFEKGKKTNVGAITKPDKYISYCLAAQEIGDTDLLLMLVTHPNCYENKYILEMLFG
jgi:hypothetical protein